MKKGESPLVSIGIPVFNAESTIKETIQCVIDQTYQNWELVISDNCSTDNTKNIIRQFKDRRIRFIENETNIGMLENFRKVANIARGDYFKLLCADDLITADCIEKQLDVFLKDTENKIACVTCDIDIIDSNGSFIMKRKIPFKSDIVNYKKVVDYFLMTSRGSIMEAFQILTKRELYLKEMLSQSNSYASKEAFCLLLHGDLYIIRETLGAYRLTRDSMTTQLPQAKLIFECARDLYLDKRFGVSYWKYTAARIIPYPVSFLRKLYFAIYAK